MAPQQVEQFVTRELESVLTAATGVTDVRSSSDIGLSVINVEFDWGVDPYTARQIVQERISLVQDRLPREVSPKLGPIASLLGQIAIVGMWSNDGTTDPIQLRSLADWDVKQRLQNLDGISQIVTMGGGRKQYQVLVDFHNIHKYEVTIGEIEEALEESNVNVAGGFVYRAHQEMIVRGIGQIQSVEDLENVVVRQSGNRPVLLKQVARVVQDSGVKRGDSTVNGRDAVVLTIQKQPDSDTRELTRRIEKEVDVIRSGLPEDVEIEVTYQQREFIDFSIHNVVDSLRDGAILITIILFIFLFNFRTTFITLTAIPVSILVTAIVFHLFDLSINVMTLGGIAVALGELVDDAIVDVENIYRRLRYNAKSDDPQPILRVVFEASREVRSAIWLSTLLVIVVFLPLFALSGIEGRLFQPLGIAYIVSILASTVVSLTVTPVLSYYLLGKFPVKFKSKDSFVLAFLKKLATPVVWFSMTPLGMVMATAVLVISGLLSTLMILNIGKDFLPPFDEGSLQLNLMAEPGTSLKTSRELASVAEKELQHLVADKEHPDRPIRFFTNRTGRAEDDEHVMGVNISEIVLSLNSESSMSSAELRHEIEHAVEDLPSVETELEQPIAHLISHLLSGVNAQIAIKVFGNDLQELRGIAEDIKAAIADLDGIAPPVIEQQQLVPQLQITVKREQLARYGVSSKFVTDLVETAMRGKSVSKIYEGRKTFDLVIRFEETYRNNFRLLNRLPIELPDGRRILLSELALIEEGVGPNTIKRDNNQRRIVVRVNTTERDLGSAVAEIQTRISERVELQKGYYVEYGGQFEAQQEATRRLFWLGMISIFVVFLIIYSAFPSARISLQILLAIPAAFVGGVFALKLTQQTLSVAAMVGFISLGGIAARNGLLLIGTYLDLHKSEGFTREMILHGSLERLAPVLMTTLTTGIGLVPMVIGGHLPGREILFPVATVILGGLISSTIAEYTLRPGLFFYLSRRAAQRIVDRREDIEVL